MVQYFPVITGSLTVNGDIIVSGTSSMSASNSVSSSYAYTASSAISSSYAYSASSAVNSFSASKAVSSSYADTASFANNFTVIGNLTVFGTQSVQYITSSQLNVSDNVITVNVASPGVRFGGLSVFDSGSLSSETTASLFWDSQNNHWIYQRESGSSYGGGMLISGPRNAAGLGNELGTTSCMLLVGQGGDHLTSSMIYHDTTCTNFYSNALFISSSKCVGINTASPQSLLDIQNCVNSAYNNTNTLTTGQWLRLSNLSTCNGVTSGILFQATGPSGGNGIATINGVTVSCGSMTLTFATRNNSGDVTEKMRILSNGTVAIGTQTQTPCVHTGTDTGGLIIQGLNGRRGIVELWDGTTSGKAVFQQINGTTYLGNLDKGTGTGELQLLVDGVGTSATTAMTLTKCGHIVVNNSPNSQADYGRMTISTCMSKLMNCSSQEHTVLNLSTCESDTPFGMKIGLYGGSCSCTRYASFQTGDHYISNQGYITFQVSGGNVGIGTSIPRTKLQVTPNYNAEVPVLGCASGIATFTSTNTNYGLQLNSTSDGSFHIQSQRFDGSATAYSLLLNYAGGNVGIGTGNAFAKLTVNGTIANSSAAGNDNYTLDTMNAYQSIANGGWVDFNGMSGFLMVNNWSNGATTLFALGGGNTTVVGTVTGTAGTTHHNPSVGGYRWCNNSGATANFGFQVFRTRNTA